MRSEEQRSLRLAGQELSYTLCRSARRRSLALSIDGRGVRLAVPARLALREAEAFLLRHGDWLLEKLAARPPQAPLQPLHSGTLLPLLGRQIRLRCDGAGRRVLWRPGSDGIEELCLPAAGEPAVLVERALRARALAWFQGRVAEYCHRLSQPLPPVRLTGARTRWGSCSRTSGIRLHWKLIHLPPELGDYVVAHEVAHLLEMNHSPRFWAVVASVYPDWQRARARLREAGRTLPRLGAADDDNPTEEN